MRTFERTRCACEACRQGCYQQPGPLAPGDLERIVAYLHLTDEQVRTHFCASSGGIVQNSTTKQRWRVGTITPARTPGGAWCIFLQVDGRCGIHEVAPAGCALFDTHQSAGEGQTRSLWLLRQQDDPAYQALRRTLPVAKPWVPKPVCSRTCGPCTLCCKVMEVPVLAKPAGTWCPHALGKRGCHIYEDRPLCCRDVDCLWLQGAFRDQDRPDKIHAVPVPTTDGNGLVLIEDAGWRGYGRAAMRPAILSLMRHGFKVVIACGDDRVAWMPEGTDEAAPPLAP